MESKGFLRSY